MIPFKTKPRRKTNESTPNCIIIAQIPIENQGQCEQGQCAELPLKTVGKVQNLGDYSAIRSNESGSKGAPLKVIPAITSANRPAKTPPEIGSSRRVAGSPVHTHQTFPFYLSSAFLSLSW